ncbi:hypothetical protein BC937DRAFT_95657 [Endogone sp. FLAS-F59071]|nr:hypothetical protein BC937DRAFT_95657 [Endogone sp. FLAS-F59071]|eukprot:RUS13221.1 hypothetical protein BC937DRAFT_95657 [Endogone sp. FLAS-F59071]
MIPAKQPPKTPTTPTSPSGPPSRVHTPTSQSPRPTSLVYSPGLLTAAMGVQATVEEPPQVSKMEIREQARGIVDSWGTVVKTVLRNANVGEELGGAAKNFVYAESNIKSTQQSLEKINMLLAQLHDRHIAALDHFRQVSQIQEALQMEELVSRARNGEGRPRSRRAAGATATASAPATVAVAAGAGTAVAVKAGGGAEQ